MQDPINILIVDDEPKNLTVLESILNDPSYRLVRAESADQALLALVAEEFALLILDIRMPGMTGFELAQIIKERRKTARVPIIFLTAYYNEDQHVLTGYDSGAVDYLHKPVNAPILRSKVAVFAELHRTQRECGLANRTLLAEMTERRRAEEQLRVLNETLEQRVVERTEALQLASERLTLAVKCSQVVLFQQDLELRYTWLQNAVSGFEDSHAIGKRDTDLMERAADAAVAEALKREVIRSGVSQRQEMPLQIAGVVRHYDLLVEPQRDAAGLISGITGAAIDITERKQAEQARHESERNYRALAEASSEVAYRMSADWSTMLSLDGRQSSDQPLADWAWMDQNLPPGEHPRVRQAICEAIDRKTLFELEHRVRRPDGSDGWTLSRAMPILDENEEVITWFGAAGDITERKLAEQGLRVSEEFNRSVLENSPDCVKILDGEGRLEFMNTNGLCLLEIDDFSPFKREFWWTLWQDETQPTVKESVAKALRGETAHFQAFCPTAKGTPKWWDVVVGPIPGKDGKTERIISVSRDITEQKEAEGTRRKAQLLEMQIQFQEAERHRIARDLHDHLGQQVTGLRLALTNLKATCGDESQIVQKVKGLQEQTEGLDRDLSQLAFELRPPLLKELGLAGALTNFVSGWSKMSRIQAECIVESDAIGRLSDEMEVNLYRMAQEAFNNTLKYSKANTVNLVLILKNNVVKLVIEDDGTGFYPNELNKTSKEKGGGLGLLGMQERVDLLAGTLEIESQPGRGTTIYVTAPATYQTKTDPAKT